MKNEELIHDWAIGGQCIFCHCLQKTPGLPNVQHTDECSVRLREEVNRLNEEVGELVKVLLSQHQEV